jgi:glutathione S-transferase
MKLYYSPTSPYVRKVSAAAIELGIKFEHETVDLYGAKSEYGKINPVHRLPSLRLDDGSMLFDSPVICEYLDSLGKGAKLFPPAGPARWKVLRLQAMGDGILDAAVPRRGETQRPAVQQSPERLSQYERSIRQTLDALERASGELEGINIGTLAVACALGYIDFRFPGDEWRKGRPKLAAWFEAISKRPSIAGTVPKG